MITLLLLMILAHIIDDFVLQPICLSKLKQRDWWITACKEANKDYCKYKDDYRAALMMHAMSWSIMIMVPAMITGLNVPQYVYLILFIVNTIIHAIIDHRKANQYKINLIQDQLAHMIQIIVTWYALAFSQLL